MQRFMGPPGSSRGGDAYWIQSTNPGPSYHVGQTGNSFDISAGPHVGYPGASAGDMTITEGGVKNGGKNLEVVPVTIAEIVTSSALGQDRMKIGNVEVHRVTIVGQVRECRSASTFVTFLLDDKTGCTIEAKLWGDSQEELAAAVVGTGKYVRIYGTVKSMGENVGVTAYSVRPLQDINEVFFHMVDVIHAHATLEKKAEHEAAQIAGTQQMTSTGFMGTAPSATGRGALLPNAPAFAVASRNMPALIRSEPCAPMPSVGLNFPQFIPDGLTPVQYAVYAYIRDGDDGQEKGTDIRPMYSALFSRFGSREVIENALEFLASEALVYATIDQYNYKPH